MTTTAENPRAVPGGNNPPSPLFEEAAERVASANRWLSERGDWQSWDKEMADKANFFIGQVGDTWKALDDQRKEEGREFKKKQDETYGDTLTLLVIAKEKLVPLRRAWLIREDDRVKEAQRKAAEEAEAKRKAAEEAAAAAAKSQSLEAELAAAKAQDAAEAAQEKAEALPERAQIKGAYTTKATGLRDYWLAEVADLSAAFKHFNKKGSPHKATLERAIRECIEGIAGREAVRLKSEDPKDFPPGVRFRKERR